MITDEDWPPKENWICDGNDEPVEEGFLVGDRKGLEALQKAIEKALNSENGEAEIKELRSQWSHVALRTKHPEVAQKDFDSSSSGKVGKAFALGFLGFIAFLSIYGCSQLPRLFR